MKRPARWGSGPARPRPRRHRLGLHSGPPDPASILLIIYGAWKGVSIVDLLAAGVVPGLTLTALFIITVVVRVMINPALGQRQDQAP